MRNTNFRTTARGLKFALQWGLARAELGRPPASVDEYADTLDESRATAFRDQQAFRRAFPTEQTPDHMSEASGAQERCDELWRVLSDRTRAVREAQSLMFFLGAAPVPT